MSGRITDSKRVKKGELLPIEFIALVDANKPMETAASIQSQFLERKSQEKNIKHHYEMEVDPSNKLRADILSMSLFPNLSNRTNLLKHM